MPNRFQENLGCARASFSNDGLCPGDSGNTVGKRDVISNISTAVHFYRICGGMKDMIS